MKATLGDRIKEQRNIANLSQQELADKIGVSKAQINRYENRGIQPPANVLNKISDALDTSVDFLVNGLKDEKAKASLKNNELLQKFKDIDALPEKDQNILLSVISAYIRDFKAKQAYKVA